MQKFLAMISLTALVACGNGGGRVSGVIGSACMAADRTAANSALCSCVQRAANQTLSAGEQNRAAEFFEDPNKAQETRRSDHGPTERFWARYKDFSNTARQMCG